MTHKIVSHQKLGVLEKIGFGAGDAAVNVVWSSMALILTFFYTDVFGLKTSDIAMLIFIPRLIDAFADVVMGMYTDSHTTRWGRYRPYLLLFPSRLGCRSCSCSRLPSSRTTGSYCGRTGRTF
jgi:GPH family glycoside/pentoside/hexuronide:cation symporter